jgi:hypothetical protein
MRRISILLLEILGVIIPKLALADTIDNPGPLTITVASGYFKVGSQRFDINPDNPPSLSGSIDSTGAATLPNVFFPDAVLSFPLIGNVTVRIEPLVDAVGDLNAVTGDGDATISLRVRLINGVLGPNCRIEPINVTATTGTSGMLTGVLYDQTAGTATMVSNDYSVPRSSGCNFGSMVDSQLGLPSSPPNNELVFNVVFDPILVGS